MGVGVGLFRRAVTRQEAELREGLPSPAGMCMETLLSIHAEAALFLPSVVS